jgi:hypothetical protein
MAGPISEPADTFSVDPASCAWSATATPPTVPTTTRPSFCTHIDRDRGAASFDRRAVDAKRSRAAI